MVRGRGPKMWVVSFPIRGDIWGPLKIKFRHRPFSLPYPATAFEHKYMVDFVEN